MYMKHLVKECDITERTYETPVEGAYVLAQGATGRWCCVLYVGPEYIAEVGIKPISREEAVAKIEEKGDGGYPDF